MEKYQQRNYQMKQSLVHLAEEDSACAADVLFHLLGDLRKTMTRACLQRK